MSDPISSKMKEILSCVLKNVEFIDASVHQMQSDVASMVQLVNSCSTSIK